LEKLYGECYGRVRNFPKLDKHLLGREILQFLNETHKYSLTAVYNISYLPLASANFDLFKKSLLIALKQKTYFQWLVFRSVGNYCFHRQRNRLLA